MYIKFIKKSYRLIYTQTSFLIKDNGQNESLYNDTTYQKFLKHDKSNKIL